MTVVLTASILFGFLRMGCPQGTPLPQTAATRTPNETTPLLQIDATRKPNETTPLLQTDATRKPNKTTPLLQTAATLEEHETTALLQTSTAATMAANTTTPDEQQRSDTNEQQRSDKDGQQSRTSNDKDGQHCSDKDGQQSNDKDGQQSNDSDEQKSNDKDGPHSSDKDEQQSNDNNGQQSNDRDGQQNSDTDKQQSRDKDGQRSNDKNEQESSDNGEQQKRDTNEQQSNDKNEQQSSDKNEQQSNDKNEQQSNDKNEQQSNDENGQQSSDKNEQQSNDKNEQQSSDKNEQQSNDKNEQQSNDKNEQQSNDKNGQQSSDKNEQQSNDKNEQQSSDKNEQQSNDKNEQQSSDNNEQQSNDKNEQQSSDKNEQQSNDKNEQQSNDKNEQQSNDKNEQQSNDKNEQQSNDKNEQQGSDINEQQSNVKDGPNLANVFGLKFFLDCNKTYWDNTPRYTPLDLNASSSLSQRTLVFDISADNTTVPPNNSLSCKTTFGNQEPEVLLLYKMAVFEIGSKDPVVVKLSTRAYSHTFHVRYRRLEVPEIYIAYSRMTIFMTWLRLPSKFRLELQYQVVGNDSTKLPMDLMWISSTKGTLRPPLWDGLSVYKLHYKDPARGSIIRFERVDIAVSPAYDTIVVSFEHLGFEELQNCERDEPSVKLLHCEGRSRRYSFCGFFLPQPEVYRCPSLSIEYVPERYSALEAGFRHTGFSLRFSLHAYNRSALVRRLLATQSGMLLNALERYTALESGFRHTGFSLQAYNRSALERRLLATQSPSDNSTLDCSLGDWQDLKEHFSCDMFPHCSGGEDEAGCQHTSAGTCPRGYYSVAGSCFVFLPLPGAEDGFTTASWHEAQTACGERGERLPTLNSEDKWRALAAFVGDLHWRYLYVGLTKGHSVLPDQYTSFLHWSDQSVAYYMKADSITPCQSCAYFRRDRVPGVLYLDNCLKQVPGVIMCENPPSRSRGNIRLAEGKTPSRTNSTRCPKGHVTHNFLSCDLLSHCFAGCYESLPGFPSSLPPSFPCHNKFERVPFTLLCDHRADCSDASDEICQFPPCQEFECGNKQCIPRRQRCDGVQHCADGWDEEACGVKHGMLVATQKSRPLPAMVLLDGKGGYDLLDVVGRTGQSQPAPQTRLDCPDSHFQCPGVNYYCLPVYVRCNGVYDCPGHQDEADCDNFKCTGLYRCRGQSKVCLHGDHVCDGVFQCPQRDDELMCGFVCPVGCTCYGLAFFCALRFDASSHAGLRFLDARGSGMSLKALVNNTMLFYLCLANCSITDLETLKFANVYHLDLSDNEITTFAEYHISSCKNLQKLVLARNPIRNMLEDSFLSRNTSLAMMDFLDLSLVPINVVSFDTFRIFRHVSYLNLSNTGIDAVSAFAVFNRLRVLDLRGCPVTYFTRSVFQGLEGLSTVYADNYKLCCPDTLPADFNVLNCHAPFDEVSSCEGLLKSGLYRVSLSVLTSMIVVGNAGSFVYRVFMSRSKKKQTSFGLFVTNLCVSDFLMGVYSAAIGVADRLYLGDYVWNDVTWRRSLTCKTAGVLSLVSNEVSVLIICLITLDRFLVIRFPFSRQLHFSPRSARLACVISWIVGVLLAVTPLLPATSHWRLYGQTGMCVPLPVTRTWFVGREYSVGVLVYLNFVLFLVIATGQLFIYLSVSANSMTASATITTSTTTTTQKAKDLTVARRLITVALSDFLCWFPVGLLGILSSRGHPIPGEANVVIAVLVLPLNSALNPFLYTVNVILEQRQRAREQRLLKMLLARHGGSTAQREGVNNAL